MSMVRSRSPVQKQRRIKSKAYLAYIHEFPCAVCGHRPVQAHHLLRTPTNERGIGRKSGDNWCIALCESHHRQLHAAGDERFYLRRYGIDGPALAQRLYAEWVAP